MPRPTKKSIRAKAQRRNGDQHSTTAKYSRGACSKFPTAQRVIPECPDMYDTLTIRRFFCKSRRYMDAYRKGLDPVQTAFAVKQFKSHHKVCTPAEIKQLLAEHELLLA